jgi:hypothetical protein
VPGGTLHRRAPPSPWTQPCVGSRYDRKPGVLMRPFHNMALMCPATTQGDADAHTALFAAAADELLG